MPVRATVPCATRTALAIVSGEVAASDAPVVRVVVAGGPGPPIELGITWNVHVLPGCAVNNMVFVACAGNPFAMTVQPVPHAPLHAETV